MCDRGAVRLRDGRDGRSRFARCHQTIHAHGAIGTAPNSLTTVGGEATPSRLCVSPAHRINLLAGLDVPEP